MDLTVTFGDTRGERVTFTTSAFKGSDYPSPIEHSRAALRWLRTRTYLTIDGRRRYIDQRALVHVRPTQEGGS